MEDLLDSGFVEQDEPRVEYAGFWVRVLAALIDGLIFVPVILLNLYLRRVPSLDYLNFISTLLVTVYKPGMEYRFGWTPGKRALKIELLGADLQKMTFMQSLLRNLPWLLSQLGPLLLSLFGFMSGALFERPEQNARFIYFLSLFSQTFSLLFLACVILVAFTKRKQGAHDMLAGTVCIYTNSTVMSPDQHIRVSKEDLMEQKARYVQRYRSLKPEELKAIAGDRRYTEAARLAAAELLEGRS